MLQHSIRGSGEGSGEHEGRVGQLQCRVCVVFPTRFLNYDSREREGAEKKARQKKKKTKKPESEPSRMELDFKQGLHWGPAIPQPAEMPLRGP